VEEYYKEVEMLLVKCEMKEDLDRNMTKDISDLNQEIQDFVKLYNYKSMEELSHKVTKVEIYLKIRCSF